MDCINLVVEAARKTHKSKWFQASLNVTDKLGSLKTVNYVNEKVHMTPLNVDHCMFQDQVYFKSPDKAKEYMLINYLIKK